MTLLALLTCAAGVAIAASDTPKAPDAPPAAETTAEGDLRYEAFLRGEYLAGHPVLVPIRLWNAGTDIQTAPDLERRPWLVSFTFKPGDGQLERRRTTPPASDPGQTIRLSPRSQRRTLMEVPLGNSLKPGEYNLQVQLDPDTIPRALATRTVRIASAEPVEADLRQGVSAAHRSSSMTVWVHKATEGFDLYLSPLDGPVKGSTQWMASLPEKVRPMLSDAPRAEGGARHVVWQRGDRGIGWMSLEGTGLQQEPRTFEVPWPKLELVARPATDGAGNLHIPVWIPAPKGSAGELRIITVMDRGTVSYRRAATFPSRPTSIASTVDDSGAMQVLVANNDALDLYTVRNSGGAHADLPVPGRRLYRTPEGTSLVDARFGLRASTGSQKGGLAVLTTTRSEAGFASAWMGLRGAVLHQMPALAEPAGATLVDILPSTGNSAGYLFKTGTRGVRFVEASGAVDLDDSLHGDWGLIRRSDDSAAFIRTAKGSIFVLQPLVPAS